MGIQEQYRARLTLVVNRLIAEVSREITPLVESAEAQERRDADIDLSVFSRILSSLRVRLPQFVARLMGTVGLEQTAQALNAFALGEATELLSFDFADEPPEVVSALDAFLSQNVVLIQSVSERLLDDVERVVQEAVQSGTRAEVLSRRLQERFGVVRSRANLIARDQVLKAHSNLTRIRHQEAGITRYEWRSSRDSRVRDRHARLHGQIFSWDDPPIAGENGERGHPGEVFQCRCTAKPVID